MAGVSTGVSLLGSGFTENLVNYWEFVGGSVNAYKGNGGSTTTSNVSTITGVDGVSSDAIAIGNASESKVRLTMSKAIPSGDVTFVFFGYLGDAHAFRWGGVLGSTSSQNFSGNGFRHRNSVGTQVFEVVSQTSPFVFTVPSFSPSSGNNGIGNFYAINIKTNTYPSQTVTFYDGSGGIISQSTQNFGLQVNTSQVGIEATIFSGVTFGSRLDKLAIFSKTLDSGEISFLYNSGSGRTITEILDNIP